MYSFMSQSHTSNEYWMHRYMNSVYCMSSLTQSTCTCTCTCNPHTPPILAPLFSCLGSFASFVTMLVGSSSSFVSSSAMLERGGSFSFPGRYMYSTCIDLLSRDSEYHQFYAHSPPFYRANLQWKYRKKSKKLAFRTKQFAFPVYKFYINCTVLQLLYKWP